MFTHSLRARCLVSSSIVVLLTLAVGCGGASSPTTPSNPTSPTSPQGPGIDFTININGDRGNQSYGPSPLTMRVGQVVNWHNQDSIDHTATLAGMFDSGNVPAFSAHSQTATFSRTGTFTYHCTIHPGMVGVILVQ